MPTSESLKGEHHTISIIIDGVTQAGSFAKLESFDWRPDAEIKKSDFVGEESSEGDLQYNGADFSFAIQEKDAAPLQFWDSIVAKIQNGEMSPDIVVSVTKSYRDPSMIPKTIVFESAVIKLDSMSVKRKEFTMYNFSGFASKARIV